MEKFNLKWNEFQSSASKSFSTLRRENMLLDVTLVTEDEVQFQAHKLILSASSQFFKNIFKKPHQTGTLMLYLSGVHSTQLKLVMDYIYEGEVEVNQGDLNSFLNISEKLRIEGLIGGGQPKEETEEFSSENSATNDLEVIIPQVEGSHQRYTWTGRYSKSSLDATVNEQIGKIVFKSDDVWNCRECGKTTKTSSDIRRHAELHIEGLSFNCPLCQQSFQSRTKLKHHKLNVCKPH